MSEFLPERDWKHLRTVHVAALDRYCARVLEESEAVIRSSDGSSHQRYLKLFRLLQDRDRTLARAFDDLRRSTAIEHLAALIRLQLLAREELAGFTEETVTTATRWAYGP